MLFEITLRANELHPGASAIAPFVATNLAAFVHIPSITSSDTEVHLVANDGLILNSLSVGELILLLNELDRIASDESH